MTQLTSQGFTRTRLDERLTALQEAMRAIFGLQTPQAMTTVSASMRP